MELTQEIEDDGVILSVYGSVMGRPIIAEFESRVCSLVSSDVIWIIVDFTNIRWFGTAMITALIEASKTVEKAGGAVTITGLGKRIQEILELTRLQQHFRTVDTVQQGLRASDEAGWPTHRTKRKGSVTEVSSSFLFLSATILSRFQAIHNT